MSTKGSETYTLEYPIEWQGSAITMLNVRRPKGRDMAFLPTSKEAKLHEMFPFFALLCGVDEGIFDEMDAADLSSFGDVINGFLSSKKPKKGARPH